MENFFNSLSNKKQTPINEQYCDLKEHYKQIFVEAAESIRTEVNKFKPDTNACATCTVKNCTIDKKDVFAEYPPNCKYRDWQKKIITFLAGDYYQKLKNTYKMIMDKKCNYECIRCGNCCRLATSEYSYEQLKQRASRGDKYSRDFVSVFVPYKSEEDAKKANPEFCNLLEETIDDNSRVYYYYCPKLSDNECSDYENRPSICKDFPHNPLKLLPSTCSFNAWKDEVSKTAMLLKAKTDIIAFYKDRLS